MSQSDRRVLVETGGGGTVELLAEPDRVVIRLEHGERISSFSLTPGGASNIGRRLQGFASKAPEFWRLLKETFQWRAIDQWTRTGQ